MPCTYTLMEEGARRCLLLACGCGGAVMGCLADGAAVVDGETGAESKGSPGECNKGNNQQLT